MRKRMEQDDKFQESVQGLTEPTEHTSQECVQGHNVDKKIPGSISNPNPHIHARLPPPLLQQLPSDQKTATTQNPTSGQTILVESMAELLKAQTQMLATQAQAASIQSLPALTPFTREESQSQLFDEDFDHWLKSFEERALVARWTAEQKLCQLKAHLKKTALQMLRLLSQSSNKSSTNLRSQKSSQDLAPQTFVNITFRGNRPIRAGSQRGQANNQPFRGGSFICRGPHLQKCALTALYPLRSRQVMLFDPLFAPTSY